MLKKLYSIYLMLFCCTSIAQQLQVEVIDANGNPVEDIVIYLESDDLEFKQQQIKLQKSEKIEISQKSKAFIPYISVIQKNQPVIFNNQDEITHHIFSAAKMHTFAFKIRSGTTNQENKFDKVGNISMGCNIHDWMSGYLLVVDTPFFDKTNQQGIANFELDFQGKIKVIMWHPQLKENEINTVKMFDFNMPQQKIIFKLEQPMDEIPQQESGEDFDFLDSY